MTVNIEKMRADQKLENKKFLTQLVAAIAGVMVASVAATTLVLHLLGKLQ